MKIPNNKLQSPPSVGADYIEILHGSGLPSGNAIVGLVDFKHAVLGTTYMRRVTANHIQWWVKVKDDSRDDDWWLDRGVILQRLSVADFTDGGSTSGTKTFNGTVPVGAYLQPIQLGPMIGFAGDVSAVIVIGDGSDVDRHNTGTPSVFATATRVAAGVPSGTLDVTTAYAPVATITTNSDFTLTKTNAAGRVTVAIPYRGFSA